MNMSLPATSLIDDKFLLEFKRQTEARWEHEDINPDIYGFHRKQRGRESFLVTMHAENLSALRFS
jgi:hypothetical protein